MKSPYLVLSVVALFFLCPAVFSDNIDMIEDEEAVVPVAPSEVPGLTILVAHQALNDTIATGGATCFAFQPGVDIVPGSDDIFIVSMCHEGGWQGDARASVYKFDKNGNLLAGPMPVSDNAEPWGFSDGWDVAAFSDGGCVAVGPSQFGLDIEDDIDLGSIGMRLFSYRVYDADLNPTTALKSVWEPANQTGNHGGDSDNVGRVYVSTLSNDRFVVAGSTTAGNLQIQVGMTDTGDTPNRKVYYRVFERDGTPVGPSRWAFPIEGDAAWTTGQDDSDVTAGGDGTFAIITAVPGMLENGDPNPIQFFDNNGDPMGEPFGVADQSLIDDGVVQSSSIGPEISYGNGIYVAGVSLKFLGLTGNTFGVTLFDKDKNILRTTYDGLRHKDLLQEVREGDMASDNSGNFFVVDRSDQTIDGGSTGDTDKIQFIQMHTKEGVPFENSFVTFPIGESAGSQRDPAIAANSNIFVISSLNEGATDSFNDSAVNSFAVYANPMEQVEPTSVDDWSLYL